MVSAGSISDDDVSKPSEGKAVDEWSLIQMAGRMEIISLHEISLAKFLGSGGYGEVTYQACYLDGHAQVHLHYKSSCSFCLCASWTNGVHCMGICFTLSVVH